MRQGRPSIGDEGYDRQCRKNENLFLWFRPSLDESRHFLKLLQIVVAIFLHTNRQRGLAQERGLTPLGPWIEG